MRYVTLVAVIATLLAGAIFGFFYAWVCSTMWGLDTLDPATAIAAMNAMNGSVRNAVFAPAFFGTPVVLGLAALGLLLGNQRRAWVCFCAAAALSVIGVLVTFVVNVPMNEALAIVKTPDTPEVALEIWSRYSVRWQVWNQVRTGTSGAALLCAAIGLTLIKPKALHAA